MKFRLLIVLLLISLPFITVSLSRQEYPMGFPECLVTFSIHNAGIEVLGTLENVTAEIEFDPNNLSQSVIKATGDPSTLKTGIGIRDKHLKRTDYFNIEKYPEIRLRPRGFRKAGRNKFIGQFDLTIKGITKAITIPFTLRHENNTARYQGSFEINRLDFNLGEKSMILDEKVKVIIEVKAQ